MNRKITYLYDLAEQMRDARRTLAEHFEERDRMLRTAVPIRERYIELFGEEERKVLDAELTLRVTEKKLALCQAAYYRREKVDGEELERELAEERERLLRRAGEKDAASLHRPTAKEQEEMERSLAALEELYKKIPSDMLSDGARASYGDAKEAYRFGRADETALYYRLFAEKCGLNDPDLPMLDEADCGVLSGTLDALDRTAFVLNTDFSLADELYDCFEPTADELTVRKKRDEYRNAAEKMKREIEKLQKSFPYNAVETMDDPEKTEEYRFDLRMRLRRAQRKQKELEEKIRKLTEETDDE